MTTDSEILRDSVSNPSSRIGSGKCSGVGCSSGFSELAADGDESPAQRVSLAFTFALPEADIDEKAKKIPDRKGNVSGADIARIALSVSDKRSRSSHGQLVSQIVTERKHEASLSETKRYRSLAIVATVAAIAIVATVAALLLSL